MVNTGEYVQPCDVLFELIDPSDIHAALTVFQKDVSRVSIAVRGFLVIHNTYAVPGALKNVSGEN
jgi:membrane fusion protein, heavy metal efflux system